MAQDDIIQKDLGLVTAYGYALAGGYQGTEEQFKRDFAALMSGQYTALGSKPSINGVTLVGNKTSADLGIQTGATLHEYSTRFSSDVTLSSEPFTAWDENIEYVFSDLYTYGNISYLSLSVKLANDITVSHYGFTGLCLFEKPSSTEDKELFKKYYPISLRASYNSSSFSETDASFVGFAYHAYNHESEIKYFKPQYWYDLGHNFLGLAVENSTSESKTLSADNSLLFVCTFMNHIGLTI